MYTQISSSSLAIESFHAFTRKSNHESMLCPCLDIESSFSENRKIYRPLSTKDCLCRRDTDTIVEIRSFSRESAFILWNREGDIEITISVISLISFTTELDRHTIFDSLWYIDRFFDFFSNLARCMTMRTLLDDLLSFSMTRSTCSSLFHHTEYCLNSFANLSVSMTRMTLLCFSSFSTTVMTRSRSIKFYFATHSEDRILERYTESHLDIFTYIGSSPRPATSTTHTTTKK